MKYLLGSFSMSENRELPKHFRKSSLRLVKIEEVVYLCHGIFSSQNEGLPVIVLEDIDGLVTTIPLPEKFHFLTFISNN